MKDSKNNHVVDEIRRRVNIRDLINSYLPLKKRGSKFVGLCPFHAEKTPSFTVSEEKGLFYCFGCKKTGGVFDFLMMKLGISFTEALEHLGEMCGVVVQSNSSNKTYHRDNERKSRMLYCIAAVVDIYHGFLTRSNLATEARDYLANRGINAKDIALFKLGYAPNDSNFILPILRDKFKQSYADDFDEEELLLSPLRSIGLIAEGKSSRLYDVFHGRIIFPICRKDGVAIGLGGRVIPSDFSNRLAKYINSKESEIYSKRRSFYAVNLAYSHIQADKKVYLVEGYCDVLAMYRAGIKNVVATCGTSVTFDHFLELSKFCKKAVILFDGDMAGRKASAAVFSSSLNAGVEVTVARLPDGQDPDSFARKVSFEHLLALLSREETCFFTFLESVIEEEIGAGCSSGYSSGVHNLSAAVCSKVVETLARNLILVKNPVERDVLISIIAEKLSISRRAIEKVVESQFNTLHARNVLCDYRSDRIHATSRLAARDTKMRLPVEQGEVSKIAQISETSQNSAKLNFNRAARGVRKVSVLQGKFDATNRSLCNLVTCLEYTLVSVLLRKPLLASEILRDEFRSLLPANVWKFVVSLAKENYVGIDELDLEIVSSVGEGSKLVTDVCLRKLAYLLKVCSLPAASLIKESLSQNRTGGAVPELILRDVVRKLSLKSFQNDLGALSTTICENMADDDFVKVVQNKLAKRRQIENVKVV